MSLSDKTLQKVKFSKTNSKSKLTLFTSLCYGYLFFFFKTVGWHLPNILVREYLSPNIQHWTFLFVSKSIFVFVFGYLISLLCIKMRRDDYFWKTKLSEEKQPIKHLPGEL